MWLFVEGLSVLRHHHLDLFGGFSCFAGSKWIRVDPLAKDSPHSICVCTIYCSRSWECFVSGLIRNKSALPECQWGAFMHKCWADKKRITQLGVPLMPLNLIFKARLNGETWEEEALCWWSVYHLSFCMTFYENPCSSLPWKRMRAQVV